MLIDVSRKEGLSVGPLAVRRRSMQLSATVTVGVSISMGEQRVPHHRKSLLASNEALYDGITAWMNNSVREWISDRFRTIQTSRISSYGNGTRTETFYHDKLMHNVELHSRLTFGVHEEGYRLYNGAIEVFNSDPNYALDMVQAVVEICAVTKDRSYGEMSLTETTLKELDAMLVAGGSKWHVVIEGEKARIESRVDQTTTDAYQQLINSTEDYARLLKTSWEYCYGRQPSPSETYTYAIRAVEAASWRIITPNNQKATLGTLINDLRAQAQASKVVFAFKDNKESDSVDTVVSLMKRLWNSQTDRHATGSFVHPSQIEAEAAVHMAITLCHFFTKGLITRKP